MGTAPAAVVVPPGALEVLDKAVIAQRQAALAVAVAADQIPTMVPRVDLQVVEVQTSVDLTLGALGVAKAIVLAEVAVVLALRSSCTQELSTLRTVP